MTRSDRSGTLPSPTVEACRAAAQLGRTVDAALEVSTLTPAAYRLLATISAGGEMATALAQKLAVSKPTLTVTTDWLEVRGYVDRKANPSDRRKISITITPEGQAALRAADDLVAARLQEVFSQTNEDSVRGHFAHLHEMLAILTEYRLSKHATQTEAGAKTSS